MLPNYINRSYAERKLVIEVVGENSEAADLDAAFETLIKQTDLPKDPHRALRELRKTDWQPGENVDDFFYRMKDLALKTKTTMTLATSIEGEDTGASVYVTSKETYKDAPRKYPVSQFPKKVRCFICDSDRHFMAQYPERHCAKCGERGYEVRYCPHTRSRIGVFQATTQHSVVHETAVVVPVKWNGKPINVMMDTGADPSVVDRHRTKDEYPLQHKIQSSVWDRADSACGLWYGLRGDRWAMVDH